jgi:hypothetical protein
MMENGSVAGCLLSRERGVSQACSYTQIGCRECLILGLLWLHHIQSLANFTMETNACYLLQGRKEIKAVMLPWQPELAVYSRAKTS